MSHTEGINYAHSDKKQCMVKVEWLILSLVLMFSGLLVAYFILNERSMLMASNVERIRL